MGSSGVKKDAFAANGLATNEANSAYNTINPIYQQMATNPTGYTPQQKSNMLTASSQALGGSVAGAVGQGNLMAARTGNIGGYSMGLDDAARQAGVQQSQNALGVENQDAALARAQQAQGLSGLSNIYGTGTQASLSALNVANNVKQPFWQQALLQGMGDASQITSASLMGPRG